MQIRIVNEEGLGRGISRSLRLRRSLDPLRALQNSGEERDWSQSIYKNNYELNSVRRLVILVAGLILGRLQIHFFCYCEIRSAHLGTVRGLKDGAYLFRGIFARFMSMRREKKVLAIAIKNSKRKLGVTTHFSEIVNLQFVKKKTYILMYFTTF